MRSSYFLSQPHQPFFLLSIIQAIVSMGLFAGVYKGIFTLSTINGDLVFLHTYPLIFFLFTNAFTGFLFTTFPRFNQTNVIEKQFYQNIFFAQLCFSLLFFIMLFIDSRGIGLAMVGSLFTQVLIVYKLYQIYRISRAVDKSDSFWILIGNGFGLLGHLLFILYFFGADFLFPFALNISVFLYLILTSFSVAQRMIPFFSHSFAPKNRYFVGVVFGLLLLMTVVTSFDWKTIAGVVYIVTAFYIGYEIKRWDLKTLSAPPILSILHVAIFWLPLGFLFNGISSLMEGLYGFNFYYLTYHTLLLGFLTTVLIGFGTRVILGHSGNVPHADTISKILFVLTQLIVLFRMGYSIDIAYGCEHYFLFDIAVTLWLLLFIVWGLKFWKVLVYKKGQ